jgi:hypothetical protein
MQKVLNGQTSFWSLFIETWKSPNMAFEFLLQFEPNSNSVSANCRGITSLQLSYLQILKFVDNFLRIVLCNSGTWNGPGRGAPRCDVTSARVHASTSRHRRVLPYHGRPSGSVRERGVRQLRTHLQDAAALSVSPLRTHVDAVVPVHWSTEQA